MVGSRGLHCEVVVRNNRDSSEIVELTKARP
jgi:hypothetical protein